MIQFYTIDSQNEIFEMVQQLYAAAFPEHERRDTSGLINLLENKNCEVNAVLLGSEFTGLCILWPFEEFVFMEHLAIDPRWRGKGIGYQVLQTIRNVSQKHILLEVEPPEDELSKKRILFYEKNGFTILAFPYVQPSYHFSGKDVPLRLMCSSPDVSDEVLSQWITRIYESVYKRT
jgi:GNAT superfamily N-acetyltransferase